MGSLVELSEEKDNFSFNTKKITEKFRQNTVGRKETN